MSGCLLVSSTMDILFGRKKSPSDLVKLVKEQLGIMDKRARDEKALAKVCAPRRHYDCCCLRCSRNRGSTPEAASDGAWVGDRRAKRLTNICRP